MKTDTADCRFKVYFTVHDTTRPLCPQIGDAFLVARFRCQGEAMAYATFAFSKFPSPHRDLARVYHVVKNDKVVFRAG